MLTFKKNTEVIADNKITLCDLEYFLTDDETLKLKSIIEAMISQRNHNQIHSNVSAPEKLKNDTTTLHVEEERRSPKPIEGDKVWQSDFITVSRIGSGKNVKYRVYMHCPVPGNKGKYIRDNLKKEFKDFGAKWTGNFDTGDIHWTFDSTTGAQDYIKAQKKRAAEKAKA